MLSKTIDAAKLSSENIEIATLQQTEDGAKSVFDVMKPVELNELIKEHEQILESEKAKLAKEKPIT